MKRLAICMPCYGRPQRTQRAIESILAQTFNDWQAYIIGDCCPDFEQMMHDNRNLGDDSWEQRAKKAGNEIVMFNLKTHEDGYGYAIRNFFHWHNNAEHLSYLDNDDTLEKDHFENYLNGIEFTGKDLVFFNSNMTYMHRFHTECNNGMLPGEDAYVRKAALTEGGIGHAELIIRSQFLKDNHQIQQTPEYGHDWKFIDAMVKTGARHAKAANPRATYNIMGAGELRETGID